MAGRSPKCGHARNQTSRLSGQPAQIVQAVGYELLKLQSAVDGADFNEPTIPAVFSSAGAAVASAGDTCGCGFFALAEVAAGALVLANRAAAQYWRLAPASACFSSRYLRLATFSRVRRDVRVCFCHAMHCH